MTDYQLTPAAVADLNEIVSYLERERGVDYADAIQEALFAACRSLAEVPGLGHRRQDLTSRNYYFHLAAPYLVVYQQETDPLSIVAIAHSARNLKRLLKSRKPI